VTVTHPSDVRNAMVALVTSALDAGDSPGTLVYLTATDVEVARLTFSKPAFGNATNGTAIANTITSDVDTTAGLVTKAKAFDGDGNEVFACDVTGPSGDGDIILSLTTVATGQEVRIDDGQLSYTTAP
jgi:hypothetical protein